MDRQTIGILSSYPAVVVVRSCNVAIIALSMLETLYFKILCLDVIVLTSFKGITGRVINVTNSIG